MLAALAILDLKMQLLLLSMVNRPRSMSILEEIDLGSLDDVGDDSSDLTMPNRLAED